MSGIKTSTTPTSAYLGYNVSGQLAEGTYYVEFIYKKNSSNSSGLDMAFVRAYID